ncbi:basic secretory protein-like protein [Pseudoalteromonas sp. XMcav11-Q]|uniref:basic secretory protein-like protein n=1 Tax=Pseudoalteromonas sp. XMcav11-Q TaxID=3136665 RepID=UPI0032C4027C
MRKLMLSAVAMAVAATLIGCNDGSEFVERDKPEQTQSSGQPDSSALRNITSDTGVEIEAVLADGVQASPAGESVDKLIDANTSTKFLAFASNVTVVFKAATEIELREYSFTSANDEASRDPKQWVVYGSNDKAEWIELDSRAGEVFSARGLTRNFELAESGEKYRYFKFDLVHGGTDSYGADITQLAELEIKTVSDIPIVAFNATNTTPEVSEYIVFRDESLVNPTSWQWTFEGGIPATSTEQSPLVKFEALGPKTITLVASNDKGEATLVQQDFIRVWEPASPWAGFPEPVIEVKKELPEHPGQLALERAVPDLNALIHEISLKIAKRLFNNVTEINVFEHVTFITGDFDAPASKAGEGKFMELRFDVKHIANLEGLGDEAIRNEVIGVLWHELTHGYNNVPAEGEYRPGTDYHTYLEALANFIRIDAGYLEHRRGGVRWMEHYNVDAYDQTAFFFEWVENSHRNTDFIRKFNAAAKTLDAWSLDTAFKSIFGEQRGIDAVFEEYQVYLASIGKLPPVPLGYQNFAPTSTQVTTNGTALVPFNEGADKLNDRNIISKFNVVLEAPAWLAQYAPDLLPIKQVDKAQVNYVFDSAKIAKYYSLATAGDNPHRFPNAWQLQGSNDGTNWITLDTQQFNELPNTMEYYSFAIESPNAYTQYRLELEHTREGGGIGGASGRLIQLGEFSLWEAKD